DQATRPTLKTSRSNPSDRETFMTSLRVHLGERCYDVHVTSADRAGLGPFARQRLHGTLAFVVSDGHVSPHADAVEETLAAAGFHVQTTVVPPGESHKSLEMASFLYDALAEVHADRKTAVVAVGGGVIGDLAGFVAATYARGLPLLMVPT